MLGRAPCLPAPSVPVVNVTGSPWTAARNSTRHFWAGGSVLGVQPPLLALVPSVVVGRSQGDRGTTRRRSPRLEAAGPRSPCVEAGRSAVAVCAGVRRGLVRWSPQAVGRRFPSGRGHAQCLPRYLTRPCQNSQSQRVSTLFGLRVTHTHAFQQGKGLVPVAPVRAWEDRTMTMAQRIPRESRPGRSGRRAPGEVRAWVPFPRLRSRALQRGARACGAERDAARAPHKGWGPPSGGRGQRSSSLPRALSRKRGKALPRTSGAGGRRGAA